MVEYRYFIAVSILVVIWNSNPVESNTVSIPEGCLLPHSIGPCLGRFRRWYFDEPLLICRSFIWGGCDSNSNNFRTLRGCRRACHIRGKRFAKRDQLAPFPQISPQESRPINDGKVSALKVALVPTKVNGTEPKPASGQKPLTTKPSSKPSTPKPQPPTPKSKPAAPKPKSAALKPKTPTPKPKPKFAAPKPQPKSAAPKPKSKPPSPKPKPPTPKPKPPTPKPKPPTPKPKTPTPKPKPPTPKPKTPTPKPKLPETKTKPKPKKSVIKARKKSIMSVNRALFGPCVRLVYMRLRRQYFSKEAALRKAIKICLKM
ncbi:uncharacterized protein LOC141902564 isoform X2 [Tubulanus polymorphus]|uniref:uncharacterized protein LOC141902564 isoform X2 n=1 Tax=Tubulanus polymorphus TaxID=672921 RepID=UPI003DA21971